MIHKVIIEEVDTVELFTKEVCKKILDVCLSKCEDIENREITGKLEITAFKMKCDAEETFIKKHIGKEKGHIWYRWRRGAKSKFIEEINKRKRDKSLQWTHISYIKFAKKEGTDFRVPIVVGKSNSSSSFDLVYTTKITEGKKNSKSWIQEHIGWEWDVENLVVFLPNIIWDEGKEVEDKMKLILYRKVAYAIETYLLEGIKIINATTEIQTIYES